MKTYELRLLDVCLPDYFLGYSGEFQTIAVPVDGTTTYNDLIESIELDTNSECRESSFYDALDSAIKNFPKQLGPSDCMSNKCFSNLETYEEDDCMESVYAYFALEQIEE